MIAETTKVKREGDGPSGRVVFEATVDGWDRMSRQSQLSLVDVLQAEAGYHPAGYGAAGRVVGTRLASGQTRVTWECSASCD